MYVKELLVDTCAVVQWMQGSLPESAQSLLLNAKERHFSVVSAWEIQLKPDLRSITLYDIEDAIAKMGMRVQPLLLEHIGALAGILSLTNLPHKDPFDHVLMAQALVNHWPILTCDQRFKAYPRVQVLW